MGLDPRHPKPLTLNPELSRHSPPPLIPPFRCTRLQRDPSPCELTHPPGHSWRDKLAALNGPLSPCTDPCFLSHTLTHPLTHSLTDSLTHPLTHAFSLVRTNTHTHTHTHTQPLCLSQCVSLASVSLASEGGVPTLKGWPRCISACHVSRMTSHTTHTTTPFADTPRHPLPTPTLSSHASILSPGNLNRVHLVAESQTPMARGRSTKSSGR